MKPAPTSFLGLFLVTPFLLSAAQCSTDSDEIDAIWTERGVWSTKASIGLVLGPGSEPPLSEDVEISWRWSDNAIVDIVRIWNCQVIDVCDDGRIRCMTKHRSRNLGMIADIVNGSFARPVDFEIDGAPRHLTVVHADGTRVPARTTPGPFKIDIVFSGGLSPSQQRTFRKAAEKWESVIVERLPYREHPDHDVTIYASAEPIDGPQGILGRAGPTNLHHDEEKYVPFAGIMDFDVDDLERLETDSSLQSVIEHEMAHVLGFGTLWDLNGLLSNGGSGDPSFVGSQAKAEYCSMILPKDCGRVVGVPVENQGGGGTQDAHWRESIFKSELMTGFIGLTSNSPAPLSRLTLSAMADLGYVVDLTKADIYNYTPDNDTSGQTTPPDAPQDIANFFCNDCKFTRPLRTIF